MDEDDQSGTRQHTWRHWDDLATLFTTPTDATWMDARDRLDHCPVGSLGPIPCATDALRTAF